MTINAGDHLKIVCDRCGAELILASGAMVQEMQADVKRMTELAGSQGWTIDGAEAECRQCAIDSHSDE